MIDSISCKAVTMLCGSCCASVIATCTDWWAFYAPAIKLLFLSSLLYVGGALALFYGQPLVGWALIILTAASQAVVGLGIAFTLALAKYVQHRQQQPQAFSEIV